MNLFNRAMPVVHSLLTAFWLVCCRRTVMVHAVKVLPMCPPEYFPIDRGLSTTQEFDNIDTMIEPSIECHF